MTTVVWEQAFAAEAAAWVRDLRILRASPNALPSPEDPHEDFMTDKPHMAIDVPVSIPDLELADPTALRLLATDITENIREMRLKGAERIFFSEVALALESAAARIETAEGVVDKVVRTLVDRPARITIELSPEGPRTVGEAIMKLAKECGVEPEKFLELKLNEIERKP